MHVPSLVYVLECESAPGDPARYYIGHTANLQRRFEEHVAGRGSAWTAKYRPLRPIEVRMGGDAEETQLTLDYMERCGIDYVRGGPWVSITLPAATITAIQQQLRAASGSCYRCGGSHFAAACRGGSLQASKVPPTATPPPPPPVAPNSIEAGFIDDTRPATPTFRQSLIDLAAAWTGFTVVPAPNPWPVAPTTPPQSAPAYAVPPQSALAYAVPQQSAAAAPIYAVPPQSAAAPVYAVPPRRKEMLCERCGRNNHMVENCFAKSHHTSGATTECRRCGRLHSATCYYKTDIDGEQLR